MPTRQLIRRNTGINWTKIQHSVDGAKTQKSPGAIYIQHPVESGEEKGVSSRIYTEKDICTQGREIYRSILRSASYLADPFVRTYVRQHARYRFQENRKRVDYIKPKDEYKRTLNRLKKGRRTAAQLIGAVNGDLEDLKNILKQAHGRTGSRRRILIKDLVRSDEEHRSTLPVTADLNVPVVIDVQNYHKYEPGPKLMALIKSQKQNPIHVVNTATIKSTSPKIEPKTMWERPIPKVRQENLRKRWWADVLDKIMPPVPEAEFQRLGDLARGKIPLERPPRRRAGLSHVVKEYSDDDLVKQLQKVGRFPDVALEFDGTTGEIIRTAAPPELVHSEIQTQGSIRIRSIRRIYAHIWNMVSTMTQDPETKEWTIKWGGGISPSHDGEITIASKADLELFEGVDELSTTYPGQTPEWFAEQEWMKVKNKDRHEKKKAQKEEAEKNESSTSSLEEVRKPQQWNDRNTARPWASRQELGHRHEKKTEEKVQSKQPDSSINPRNGVRKAHETGRAFRRWTPKQEPGHRQLHTTVWRRDGKKKSEEAEKLESSTNPSEISYVTKEQLDRDTSLRAISENSLRLITHSHPLEKSQRYFSQENAQEPSVIRALGKKWAELSPIEREQQMLWTQEHNASRQKQKETKLEKLRVKPFRDLSAKQRGRIIQEAWVKMIQSEQQRTHNEAWENMSPKVPQTQTTDSDMGDWVVVLPTRRDEWFKLNAEHQELKKRRRLEKLEAKSTKNELIRRQLEERQTLEDEVSERLQQLATTHWRNGGRER